MSLLAQCTKKIWDTFESFSLTKKQWLDWWENGAGLTLLNLVIASERKHYALRVSLKVEFALCFQGRETFLPKLIARENGAEKWLRLCCMAAELWGWWNKRLEGALPRALLHSPSPGVVGVTTRDAVGEKVSRRWLEGRRGSRNLEIASL